MPLSVPYIKQPDDNACALASYTMVAKYFFPKMTLGKVAKIADWQPGYVVWAFKFWLWIMDRGVRVTDYDMIDYTAWTRDGVAGLKKSVSAKEFDFYLKNTKNIDAYADDIVKMLAHKNFKQIKKKPSFSTLTKALREKKICEVVLDSRTLH